MLIMTTILVSLLLAPSAHHRYGLTEAKPRIDGTMRVASYNMLNFFDQEDDRSLQGEYDDFGDNPGPTSFERCQELAKAIRAVDADVLALQEIESEAAIRWFRDRFLADMGYEFIASRDVGYYRGIEQGVLSRFPITEVWTWPNADLSRVNRAGGGWADVPAGETNISFQRSPIFVTIKHPSGYELSLFSVHHKAGSARWLREAESLQIMEYVTELNAKDPERNILVVGDFNAQPWHRSMQVYFRGGMIDAMTMRGGNAAHGDTSPARQTHTSGRIIDFMLMNKGALDELVEGSGFVYGTSAEEYDWRNDPIPSGYASDHYPIVIDIVPAEGGGDSVSAPAWPSRATRTAMSSARKQSRAPAKPAAQTPPSTKQSTSVSANGFVASKRSDKFHKADCRNVSRIKESNLVKYASIEEAEAAKKKPAGCCKPSS